VAHVNRVGRPRTTSTTLAGGSYFPINGVIWQNTSSGALVCLDPGATGVQKTGYTGALGSFGDAIMPPATVLGGLTRTSLIYVRGLGWLIRKRSC
jgi:hypothetical protein